MNQRVAPRAEEVVSQGGLGEGVFEVSDGMIQPITIGKGRAPPMPGRNRWPEPRVISNMAAVRYQLLSAPIRSLPVS